MTTSRTVHCRKYQEPLEGLDAPPMPGPKGEELFETVSKKAWLAWQDLQTMLINEKHLNMRDAESRKYLSTQRERFFDNLEVDRAEGYIAPEGASASNTEAPEYCRAQLNYAAADDIAPTEVSIRNGRKATDLTWEKNGFELLKHESRVTDWNNETQLADIYYAEMVAEAKRLTGCRTAIISGHIARNPEQAKEHSDYAPIQYVHSDFTDNYGELVKQRYAAQQPFEVNALARAGIELEEFLNAEHIMILQFWRNVGPTAMDQPLAFCDAATVPREDIHAFHVPNYADSDFPFDTYGISAPTAGREHHWYAFPELSADEVVALRTFDSRRVGTDLPYWTPHTAFVDPNLPSAPPRYSIEVRATCLF